MKRACGWGPQFCEDGSTVFRLWAPAESTLALEIDGRRIAMERQDDGWFAVRLDSQPVGALYGFVLFDGRRVPDPASRFQPLGIDGPSLLCGPDCFAWRQADWCGRPWEEAVFYELHVGTFTRDGTYDAAIEHLPRLAEMGFTAIELMPIAQFPGRWGWGYDGVFQFAPHNAYGTPDELKRLVDAAHQCGLMVFLDVVYNHFGPEGNFLPHYAPGFFHSEDPTPWGSRIAFDEPAVRSYFIGNVLHWLQEYRFDGLRLDAVDQIVDAGTPHILQEISHTADATFTDRQVHLVVENPSNGGDLLVADETGHRLFAADWNDEFHHAMHVAVTGEAEGHYAPYKDRPWKQVKQALAKGYLKQGKTTVGSALPNSACLPPTAFVHFLQNHDQVGNRALGDRLHTSLEPKVHRLLTEILLPHLVMPAHHDVRESDINMRRLHGNFAAAAERGPADFEGLLLTPGVGARTVQALALVAEVVHGAPCRFSDPARFSLAHGGKDRHPFPVPLKVNDETIGVMKSAVRKARLGVEEELQALKRLDEQSRQLERYVTGPDLKEIVAGEFRRSAAIDGRSVFGWERDFGKSNSDD